MESLSLTDRQTALHILDRIEEAINTVQIRNSVIRNADDFLLTPEGREKLDAACMVIEAIGESFKNLDKLTKFDLLPLYPSIEWKEVKGVRDVIELCQGTGSNYKSKVVIIMPRDWYLTYLITQALFDKFLIGKFGSTKKCCIFAAN